MAAYISFQPSDYFSTVLYTGNQPADNAITGVGFSPNFVWVKNRDATTANVLFDTVRGVGKSLYSNTTGTEVTDAAGMKSFDADGFTVGDWSQPNTNGDDYVSWNWKAGTTSGLSGGTITPAAYSINTTSGFGIYQRVGTATAGTIAHGLGAVPKFIIHKGMTWSSNWRCYHVDVGNDKCLNLNETGAAETNTMWNDTTPTDTVYSTGSNNDGNKSGESIIEYVFTEKTGFSKFGKYQGNGNADGAFIYTGFKPTWLLIRRTDSEDNWTINDYKRLGYNADNNELFANLNNAEDSNDVVDLLSNGFKLRHTAGRHNTEGADYVYAAFGQTMVGTNNVPATAR